MNGCVLQEQEQNTALFIQLGSLGWVWEPLCDPLMQDSRLAQAASIVGHISETHPGFLTQLIQRNVVFQRPKVASQECFTFCLEHASPYQQECQLCEPIVDERTKHQWFRRHGHLEVKSPVHAHLLLCMARKAVWT